MDKIFITHGLYVQQEMEEHCAQIKDLTSGNQESVPFDSIISYIEDLK